MKHMYLKKQHFKNSRTYTFKSKSKTFQVSDFQRCTWSSKITEITDKITFQIFKPRSMLRYPVKLFYLFISMWDIVDSMML